MNVRRRELLRLPLGGAGATPETSRSGRSAPGSEPGLLTSRPDAAPPRVTVIAYGPHEITEHPVSDLEQLREMRGKWPVLWVNVDGVGHAPTLRAIGEVFCLHALALEDLTEVPQRAKVEHFSDHLFILARMARLLPKLDIEQISIFLGPDFVVTFQEREGDPLEPVRARLRAAHPRIRSAGPDYLAYALLDAIIDHFFPVLETYADRLDTLEDVLSEHPSRRAFSELHHLKRELMSLRRAIWPLRDALGELVREPGPLVAEGTGVYLRDCQDHVFQVMDLVETYRDVASSLTDLYLSTMGNRTNDIMKVLTIFASLFIPLGFITGIYGMNVEHPRAWWWDLSFSVWLMVAVAIALLAFFWRKGWIGWE